MNELEPANLLELILLTESAIDYQIEFWLTVSFATIVGCFAGRALLTKQMRWIVAVLYLVATALFASRWLYNTRDVLAFTDALVKQGVQSPTPWWTGFIRIVLMVFGTIATIYFILYSSDKKQA
jgi:hypothetical protein